MANETTSSTLAPLIQKKRVKGTYRVPKPKKKK